MMSKRTFFLSLLLMLPIVASAQYVSDSSRMVTRAILIDGDTIPYVSLPLIDIITAADPNRAENLKRYLKIRRDVIKAYPYARVAADALKNINDTVSKMPNQRSRNRYVKAMEKEMKERFEADLKKLTYSQGKILIKLVDRETGTTSYELVKELRGSIQAFFWQSMARFFGVTLKSEYDPEGEDAVIESIVRSIERGEIQVVKK